MSTSNQGRAWGSPHDIEPAMAKKKHLPEASGTPSFRFMNHGSKRKGAVMPRRFHSHVLRTKREVRNAVQYVLRNAERHGLHDAWPGTGTRSRMASVGVPRPDPLSTAAWFPFWAEQELLIAPTQIPASVVRPAQCFLMKFAFEGAPLSFAEPMRCATGTPRLRSKARTEPTEVERRRGSRLRRIKLRDGTGKSERPPSQAPRSEGPPDEGALAAGRRSARLGPLDR
jgi:hypothetical protein